MSYYDSTVASYDTQISNNNQRISDCYKKIAKLEDDIEELKRLRIKIGGVDDAVKTAVTATSNKIDLIPHIATNPFAIIKLNYFDGFLNILKGTEHTRAKKSIDSAITKVITKIKELQNEIENLASTINQCRNNISSLQQQKNSYVIRKENEQRQERVRQQQLQQQQMQNKVMQGANQQTQKPKAVAQVVKPASKKSAKKDKDLGNLIGSLFKK